MISRYEAYMDGVALSSIHPDLLITDIRHAVADYDRTTQATVNRDGSRILKNYRNTTGVSIFFRLRIYDISERQKALQKVQQWASGQVLETNDRVGQRLFVHCDKYPVISSALKWLETLSITFYSYEKPFWEEKTESVARLTGNDEEGSLFVPGNAGDAFVEVKVTPSATITSLTVMVGDTFITLSGISTNSVITIGYDENGNQYIKAGTTSILNKRTASSSDDLLAKCGEYNTVSVIASASVTAEFKARGVWM